MTGGTAGEEEVPARQDPGRLVVVRHGATEWSGAGRHTGRTDVDLVPEGEAQARALGTVLAGHRFSRVLVSPRLRARRTAELAGFGSVADECADLEEWDYGEYEGLTTAEIRRRRPTWSLWTDGVPGGESIEQVAERAERVVSLVRRSAGDVLAFAHGHILRIVAARWIGLPPTAGASLLLWPAALGVLGWERDTPAVVRWNDTGGDPLG
jgi:probable phosphoglycerate mutase